MSDRLPNCTIISKESIVSRYDLEEIVQKWAKEDLTQEQVIGQLLLHVKHLDERLTQTEKELASFRAEETE